METKDSSNISMYNVPSTIVFLMNNIFPPPAHLMRSAVVTKALYIHSHVGMFSKNLHLIFPYQRIKL